MLRGKLKITDGKYIHVWEKYRPAILSLMVASKEGQQEYKFSNHEFQDFSPSKTSGYSFLLRVYQGRAINNLKTSDLAPDLLHVLKGSEKAMELAEDKLFEFELDRDFKFYVRSMDYAEESAE